MGDRRPQLDFESVNLPVVMGPWEIREHIVFLLNDAVPHPALVTVQQVLLLFSRRWQALWSCYSESRDGWGRYRELLDETRSELVSRGVNEIGLRNETGLMESLVSHVLDVAMADHATGVRQTDRHGAAPVEPERARSANQADRGRNEDEVFDRPLFIVSPPRSGSTLLFETLSGAPDVYTIGDESHQLIEGVPGLAPSQREYDSNRLAADATPAVARELRSRFLAALRDRASRARATAAGG